LIDMGYKPVSESGGEIPPFRQPHLRSRRETPDFVVEVIQRQAEAGAKAIVFTRKTKELSRVTATYNLFAEELGALAKGPKQFWKITVLERHWLMSSLEEVPQSKLRDDLHEKLNGSDKITAEWLADACELIWTGLSDLHADTDKLAARRSELISFEIEPQTRAELTDGMRMLPRPAVES
jgi:hypothetical protein